MTPLERAIVMLESQPDDPTRFAAVLSRGWLTLRYF